MFEMTLPTFLALSLTTIFASAGLLNLAGPRFVRQRYAQLNFRPGFHRVAGAVQLIAAAFLSNPFTRIWGVMLAALILFAAIVVLLNGRRYVSSAVGMFLLAALVPAALAGAV